jgi:hypothetical protein
MGMSTFVVGIKPPDDHWRRMKAAWDACQAAGIEPPDTVYEFFNGEPPDEKGVVVGLDEFTGDRRHESVTEWSSDTGEGYEVDVTKLPKDVTVVRFWNSW